jgi:hypothetical protein
MESGYMPTTAKNEYSESGEVDVLRQGVYSLLRQWHGTRNKQETTVSDPCLAKFNCP